MFKVPMLPRSLEAVCRDLVDPNARVRLSAIQESSRHADGEGRSRIIALLIQSLDRSHAPGESRVRPAALVALADAQATEAISAITPLLSDGDAETRRSAILALGELAPSRDVDILSRIAPFLTAADPRIRYQAVAAMVAIAGAEALEALASAAEDSDPLIRELAVRLFDDLITSAPSEPGKLRGALERLACDSDLLVRAVAQLACHEHGIGAPTDGLIALISGAVRGREASDVQVAIELAGRLRLRDSLAALERRAFGFLGFGSDPFRFHARAALAVLGHEAARRSVERGLKRGSRVERSALIFALGQVCATEFAGAIAEQTGDPVLRPGAEQALLALGRDGS